MSLLKKNLERTRRRSLRVRNRLKLNSSLPRVSVFRSLKQIYAQIIDDAGQKTLVSFSSLQLKGSGDKTTVAKAVGVELAKKAQQAGIEAACFDRGPFLYHGRVKALAEGLREGGLKI